MDSLIVSKRIAQGKMMFFPHCKTLGFEDNKGRALPMEDLELFMEHLEQLFSIPKKDMKIGR